MKVIVTGSTGTVGSAVLQSCIDHPSITSIIALTRRALDVQNRKVKNIIKTDYHHYDDEVLSELKGAQACIWALGSPTSGKEVHIDYTMAAVNTFLAKLAPELEKGQKFRFVYTSGGAVPYLASSALFFLGAWRTLRENLDQDILALGTENADRWDSFVVRPWFVVDEKPRIGSVIANSYVYRKELGAAMVDAAVNGGEKHLLNNADLRANGQAALGKLKL